MADALALGASAARHAGSSPVLGKLINMSTYPATTNDKNVFSVK